MYPLIFRLLWVNKIEVAATFLSLAVAVILYRKGRQDFLQKIILALVTEAEKKLGSGTGELKYAMVVERLYAVLPWILRLLYSQKQIDRIIEEAVVYLRRYLTEGKNLLGYEQDNKPAQ